MKNENLMWFVIQSAIVMFCFVAFSAITSCSKKTTTVIPEPEPPPPIEIVEDPGYIDTIVMNPGPVKPKIKRLTTIYFKLDSDMLYAGESWKVSGIDGPVELTGACCPLGTDSYNYTLGMRRAIAVRNVLEERGVIINSIKSVGERELITTNPERYHLNRRVEVKY